MTVSDIARMRLASIKESAFGVQETGANLQTMRITQESLKQVTETAQSREIRDDRQVPGVIRIKIGITGSIEFELSYASFDDYFAAALSSVNVKAQGTLTMDVLPTDGDTITFDSTTYTFKDTLGTANDIKIEAADLSGTQDNLVATINGTGTAGVEYYAGTTTPHASVRAGAFASDDSIITALVAGVAGNSIATTETFTAGTNVFDAATLGTTTAGTGWTAPVTVGPIATISAASGDNSFNDSGSGFTFTAGEWVEVRGFTETANNGYFKIVSATTAKIVVSGGTLVTEAAGDSVTIVQGSSIVNGVAQNWHDFEREHTDLTNKFDLYVGCMIDQLSMSLGMNNIVTGSMGIVGKVETSESSSGGTGYEDANSNEIMNSIDHLIGVYENQASVNLLDFSFTVANNLRERQQIGEAGPISFGADAMVVTGSFTAYYESETLYDKYLNFTTTSLAKVFEDTAGNAYVIDMPEVKITDASRHAGAGLGDDFKIPCTFQAVRDATEDVTIRIVKFAA